MLMQQERCKHTKEGVDKLDGFASNISSNKIPSKIKTSQMNVTRFKQKYNRNATISTLFIHPIVSFPP